MVDPDQSGEDFDDELLADEFPPDEPLAVEDEGITGVEQLGGESVAERDERTEPEVWERQAGDTGADAGTELSADAAGVPDTEKDLVGERADSDADGRGRRRPRRRRGARREPVTAGVPVAAMRSHAAWLQPV